MAARHGDSCPFSAGILFLLGMEYLGEGETLYAILKFALAAALMSIAWRWTR